MAAVKVSRIRQSVAALLPRIPDPVIDRLVVRAARRLCADAEISKMTVPFGIEQYADRVDLTPYLTQTLEQSDIHEVLEIRDEDKGSGRVLEAKTQAQLGYEDHAWQARDGRPEYFTTADLELNTVRLVPRPKDVRDTGVEVASITPNAVGSTVVTSSAHGYEVGQRLFAEGPIGPDYLINDKIVYVTAVNSTTSFDINATQLGGAVDDIPSRLEPEVTVTGLSHSADGTTVTFSGDPVLAAGDVPPVMLSNNSLAKPLAVGEYVTFTGAGVGDLDGGTYRIDEVVDANAFQYKILDGVDTQAYAGFTGNSPTGRRVFRLFRFTPVKWVARVALIPSESSSYLPYSLLQEYEQTLLHAVYSDCYKIPDKPWTDVNLANQHELMYIEAAKQAKARSEQENVRATKQKVRYGGY